MEGRIVMQKDRKKQLGRKIEGDERGKKYVGKRREESEGRGNMQVGEAKRMKE